MAAGVTEESFPSFSLDGRVALVTGAARGLGRAIALALAHAGADVALGLRDATTEGAVAEEVEALGRRALPLQMDMTDLGQVRAAVAQTAEELGGLDILVNNAGVGFESPSEQTSEEQYDTQFAINVKGAYFASQAAAQVMAQRGYGRIVNLSSQAGLVALPGASVYCMTKAAISHMTKCHAVEWGTHGINVNAVAPTFIDTPGTADLLARPRFRAEVLERIAALHRIGEPVEVSGAVVFLCSPAASLITGETLAIDGGWTAR